MVDYEYNYKDEAFRAQPSFGYYKNTGNLYFTVRIHGVGVMSRLMDITEKYNVKLPYLHSLIWEGYKNSNINFLLKYNFGEVVGDKIIIDDGEFIVFKFYEEPLQNLDEKMLNKYKDNFSKYNSKT